MPTLPNVIPRYQSRRKDLTDQLQHSKSKTAKEQLQLALFVTDAAAAALYDVSSALQTVASKTRTEVNHHLKEVTSAREDLEESVSKLARSGDPALEHSFLLVAHVAQLRASSATTGFQGTFLQWDLLSAVGVMWLEILGQLYDAADRSIFFAQVEKLLEFAASRLPGVGDTLDLLKVAAEVYAVKKVQAKTADEYFASLESYLDAGNLFLFGAMSFCARVESLASDGPSPTQGEIEDRIARHKKRVATRTHPATEVS